MAPPPARPRRGPESQFFDVCKGRVVEMRLAGSVPDYVRCKILWVDVFTVGVAYEDSGVEEMIYKRAIFGIRKPVAR